MSIHGVGIDVVDVSRVTQLIHSSDRFVQRWFTTGEIAECQAVAEPARAFAQRFAAKEAVWKALRLEGWPGFVPWHLIGIGHDGGRAGVELAGEVAELAAGARIGQIHLDWLVAESVAVAIAVVESRG